VACAHCGCPVFKNDAYGSTCLVCGRPGPNRAERRAVTQVTQVTQAPDVLGPVLGKLGSSFKVWQAMRSLQQAGLGAGMTYPTLKAVLSKHGYDVARVDGGPLIATQRTVNVHG